MKRIFLSFLFAVAILLPSFAKCQPLPMKIHQSGASKNLSEVDRVPISIPLSVFYDTETNVLEVWCDNDNIQAEVFVYDESGAVEAYSPYMNVSIQLPSSVYK